MNKMQKEFLEEAESLIGYKGKNEIEVLTSQYPVETSFGEVYCKSPALRGLESRGYIKIVRSFWRGALVRLTGKKRT